jgi:hypothetical protein
MTGNQTNKQEHNTMKTILMIAMTLGIFALPVSSSQACTCGGKEKCQKCCGEKCKDCTKDCCKK